jgi:leader peptidase (prepilin peptidase) / N-methyltransferase
VFPEWTWIVGLLLGATIGSFLNVVIYRTPKGMSLSDPKHSFCPKCEHRLGVADLFPLFSWLFSRGRCRHCKEPVPIRYFLVELINGAIWAGLWYRFLVVGWSPATAIAYAAAVAILVAIIFIDWELYMIPDELNAALLIVALAYRLYTGTIVDGLIGALVGWGLLWGIAVMGRVIFQKDAMGHGDIKMMRGVGALLGAGLLAISLALAVVSGLVIGLILIAVESSMRKKRGETEPEPDADEAYVEDKEPIGSLMFWGGAYLVGLDVFAVLIPPLRRAIEAKLPEGQAEEEEDDWKPSLTTIPFGPYLAIGSIVCMLFGNVLLDAFNAYWRNATEPNAAQVSPHIGQSGLVAGFTLDDGVERSGFDRQ